MWVMRVVVASAQGAMYRECASKWQSGQAVARSRGEGSCLAHSFGVYGYY